MLLASKYEEIYPPQIRDLVFITDRAYNRDQILEMESTMANALQFRLTVPTIYCFLLRYLKVSLPINLLFFCSTYFVNVHVSVSLRPSALSSGRPVNT